MNDLRNKPPPLTVFGPPAPRKPLSAVQEEIAQKLARGAEIDDIGQDMGMHATSVKYHITQIARALNMQDCGDLTDREQVIVWAFWAYRQQGAA